MMKALKLADGGRGFAFTITQTYLFVLLVCGVLAFMFTGWFLYHNRREFLSLIKILRFHAVRSHSDDDLENGRNDQWELGTAHSEEDEQAGSGDSKPTTEDGYDPYDGYYLCNEDHRHDWTCEKDWKRYTNERKVEQVPDHWCYLCRKYHEHGWPCSNNEDEDQHDCSHSTTENEAIHLTPSSPGSDAEPNTSTARPPTFDNWYAPPDDMESCASCDSEHTKDIPSTRPAAHREPLTPTSPATPFAPFASDAGANADADAETPDTHPKGRLDPDRKRENGREMRDQCESEISQRCRSEECRCRRPGPIEPYIETLSERLRERYGDDEADVKSWADKPGYVAGVEDKDNSEKMDSSNDATIERREGGHSETRNNEDRDVSHSATPVQGVQSEREDTGSLNNVQEPSDQITSAGEQRQGPTGTAFSPPVRHPHVANTLADETGHSRGPPVGVFRHGVIRPLRLIIPTESFEDAEPRAPTTPVNTHSLVERVSVAKSRDGTASRGE